mmetsp:Transcript_59892/g.104756  ORF Transcript_59892/g.104756 Transcript_59892/m.104756 type:complete len:349 (+) Transcript_59892:347-1393(+)
MVVAPPGDGRARRSSADGLAALPPKHTAESPPGARRFGTGVEAISAAAVATADALPTPTVRLFVDQSELSPPSTTVATPPTGPFVAVVISGCAAKFTEVAPPGEGLARRTSADSVSAALPNSMLAAPPGAGRGPRGPACATAAALPTPRAALFVDQSAPCSPKLTEASPPTGPLMMLASIGGACAVKSKEAGPPGNGRASSASFEIASALAPRATESTPPGAGRTRGSALAMASKLPSPWALLLVDQSEACCPRRIVVCPPTGPLVEADGSSGVAPKSMEAAPPGMGRPIKSSTPTTGVVALKSMDAAPPGDGRTFAGVERTASVLPTPWTLVVVDQSELSLPKNTVV